MSTPHSATSPVTRKTSSGSWGRTPSAAQRKQSAPSAAAATTPGAAQKSQRSNSARVSRLVTSSSTQASISAQDNNTVSETPSVQQQQQPQGNSSGSADSQAPIKTSTCKGGDLLASFNEVFGTGEVNSLCFVPSDPSQIWSGGNRGAIAVYNGGPDNYQPIFKVQTSHGEDITALCAVFSQDAGSSFVWCGFRSGNIIVFDCSNFQQIMEVKCHSEAVTCIARMGGEQVWSASVDGTVRIWSSLTMRPLRKLDDRSRGTRALVYVEGTQQVWSANDSGAIFVRDVDGNLLNQFNIDSGVTTLRYTCGNVWCTTVDGSVHLYDPTNLKCLKTISAHQNPIDSCIVTTRQVWSCSSDKIQIFDAKDMKSLKNIKAKKGNTYVKFLEILTRERVAAVCTDKKIRIWSTDGDRIDAPMGIWSTKPFDTSDVVNARAATQELSNIPLRLEEDQPEENDTSKEDAVAKEHDESEDLPLPTQTPRTNRTSNHTSMMASPSLSPIQPDNRELERDRIELEIDTSTHVEELRRRLSVPDASKPILSNSLEQDLAYRQQDMDIGDDLARHSQGLSRRVIPAEAFLSSPVLMQHAQRLSEQTSARDKQQDRPLSSALNAQNNAEDARQFDASERGLYEQEIVSLRNQLRDMALLVSRSKKKLAARKIKLEERDVQIRGLELDSRGLRVENEQLRSEKALLLKRQGGQVAQEAPIVPQAYVASQSISAEKYEHLRQELEIAHQDVVSLAEDMRQIQFENDEMRARLEERGIELSSLKHVISKITIAENHKLHSPQQYSSKAAVDVRIETLTQVVQDYAVELMKTEKRNSELQTSLDSLQSTKTTHENVLHTIRDQVHTLCALLNLQYSDHLSRQSIVSGGGGVASVLDRKSKPSVAWNDVLENLAQIEQHLIKKRIDNAIPTTQLNEVLEQFKSFCIAQQRFGSGSFGPMTPRSLRARSTVNNNSSPSILTLKDRVQLPLGGMNLTLNSEADETLGEDATEKQLDDDDSSEDDRRAVSSTTSSDDDDDDDVDDSDDSNEDDDNEDQDEGTHNDSNSSALDEEPSVLLKAMRSQTSPQQNKQT